MNHETFEMPRTVWTGQIVNEVEKTFKTEGSSENKLQRIENIQLGTMKTRVQEIDKNNSERKGRTGKLCWKNNKTI